ncbi:MAG: hypothetical protein EXR69_07790 [Myxococcales bacterium]|nr:hypothetical protein [Myxococcales bacterium]
MEWTVAPRMRMDLVCFAGLNLAGERRIVDVHAVGGRQGGDVAPEDLKSLVVLGAVGTRVLLKTAPGDDWEKHPWRAILVTKAHHYRTKEGETGVRVPDLDWFDKPDARRTDTEVQETFPYAETYAEGLASGEWTFGRPGPLKQKVKAIVIDKA